MSLAFVENGQSLLCPVLGLHYLCNRKKQLA